MLQSSSFYLKHSFLNILKKSFFKKLKKIKKSKDSKKKILNESFDKEDNPRENKIQNINWNQ